MGSKFIQRKIRRQGKWFLVFSISLLVMILFSPAQSQQPQADLVFTNAKIWTGDVQHSRAEAVAIQNGKFIKVGTDWQFIY